METNEMLELILGEVRKVSDKVDRLESRMDNLEKRMDSLEIKVNNIEKKVEKLEIKVNNIEQKAEKLEIKSNAMEVLIKDNFAETQKQVVKVVDILRNEDRQNKEIIKSILYDVEVLKTRI